jgi:hypothetical protein
MASVCTSGSGSSSAAVCAQGGLQIVSSGAAVCAQGGLQIVSSNSSGRQLSSSQQQRSFTDLDSSVEGFVKEVSLAPVSVPFHTVRG